MAICFILICATPGKELEVYTAVSQVQGVTELHSLFGEYDIIAKIQADDFDEIGNIIIHEIRYIEGVIDTKTLTGTRF
ncbi:MAG: Lrp/AsnC family transcriptional regulator [Candidatus Thermoplasmatota archaeon]|nr:Lrp/AsnC family transcriptional regulator [Candidatus Thermoplasmatota archaeon]